MADIRMTVAQAAPNVVEGVSQKTGKAYRFVTQAVLFQLPDGSVRGGEVVAPRGKDGKDAPFAPGAYVLAPGSISVREGRLSLYERWLPVSGGTK